jgi:hypothetical protein
MTKNNKVRIFSNLHISSDPYFVEVAEHLVASLEMYCSYSQVSAANPSPQPVSLAGTSGAAIVIV